MRTEPRICARCRHWSPIWPIESSGPIAPGDDKPGECFGQIGRDARWNGIWMKQTDSCTRWQLSPLRAGISLVSTRPCGLCLGKGFLIVSKLSDDNCDSAVPLSGDDPSNGRSQ